jgi:hypothetical protein
MRQKQPLAPWQGSLEWSFATVRITDYALLLGTGRPLGAADFLDQLEQLIDMSLRRKKGGWQTG